MEMVSELQSWQINWRSNATRRMSDAEFEIPLVLRVFQKIEIFVKFPFPGNNLLSSA